MRIELHNERGEFKLKRFKPWEILPFWKDDERTELDFFARVYDVWTYEGKGDAKKKTYVDVYDVNGIHHFERSGEEIIPNYSYNYFELQKEGVEDVEPYNWERVPLIALRSNDEEIPLIRKCKSLQDGINTILSNFGDGMQQNASGDTILVIHNYGGTNLGEFRRNLMQYKAVKVETVDGADGGIDTLQVEVNCENYRVILTELRKALISNCKGYDVEELKSNGSPNEMTIKAIFSAIDMDANEIETEFQAGFEDLMWFVNSHLKNSGVGDFENESLEFIFNRDLMVNESQIIADCQNSTGIISQKTIIANHPWTTDPEAEWQQVQDEQSQTFADTDYTNAFSGDDNTDEGGDDVNEDS